MYHVATHVAFKKKSLCQPREGGKSGLVTQRRTLWHIIYKFWKWSECIDRIQSAHIMLKCECQPWGGLVAQRRILWHSQRWTLWHVVYKFMKVIRIYIQNPGCPYFVDVRVPVVNMCFQLLYVLYFPFMNSQHSGTRKIPTLGLTLLNSVPSLKNGPSKCAGKPTPLGVLIS